MHTYSTTAAQLRLLNFIKAYIAEHGVAPSYRDMELGTGIRRSRCHSRVMQLVERGRLRKLDHRARALEVIPEPFTPRARVIPLDRYGPHNAKMFVVERVNDQAKLVPMEGKK